MTADIFTFTGKGTRMTEIQPPCDTEQNWTPLAKAEYAVKVYQDALADLFEIDPALLRGVSQTIERSFHGERIKGVQDFRAIMSAAISDAHKLLVKVNNHQPRSR